MIPLFESWALVISITPHWTQSPTKPPKNNNTQKAIPKKNKKIIDSLRCKKAIKLANRLIKDKGRLLVRPSGTEPKVRIMCETSNLSLMKKCVDLVKKTIH